MFDGIKNLFAGRPSKEEAKGRLHLVLAHDRSGLDGARLQELRDEIAAVIARFVEIDHESVEISVERLDRRSTQLMVSSPLRAR